MRSTSKSRSRVSSSNRSGRYTQGRNYHRGNDRRYRSQGRNYTYYYNPWNYNYWYPSYYYWSPWSSFYGWYGLAYSSALWYHNDFYGYPGFYPGMARRYGYYAGGYYGPFYHSRRFASTVRVKVSPKDADVFVNGTLVGKARRYDGWPSQLYLEPGTHELIFYRDGMETERREIEVKFNTSQKIRVEMRPGEAVPANKISKALKKKESEREQLYRRYSKDRDKSLDPPRPRRESAAPEPQQGDRGFDMRSEGGALRLMVSPDDAVIYIDGRFLSTAADLKRGGGQVMLDPGEHEVEIFIPGESPRKHTVTIEPDKTTDLSVNFDENGKEI